MATFEEAAISGEEFMRRTKPNGEAKPGPALVTAEAFVSGFKPPQYEIDGLLRRGCIYSVTALTGHGKTAVCLCLEMHLALGRDLHGHSVEQGTAVYFAAENPDDTKMRVVLMADRLNLDLGTLPMHFVEGGFSIEDWTDHIRGQVEAIGGCSSVTIDTGPAFQAACGFTEENDNMQALRFALALRSFTQLPGSPVVLVPTHPVKNASKENLLPRGGSAFLNEMDGNLTLWAEGDRNTTELSWAGKLRGPSFEPLAFALETGKCDALVDAKGRHIPSVWAHQTTAERAERAASRNREDEDAMLITLQNAPVGSIATWAKSIGWILSNGDPAKSRVHRALERLKAEKLVTQRRGRWVLTNAGKKEAERLEGQAT
jgi:AAA domain